MWKNEWHKNNKMFKISTFWKKKYERKNTDKQKGYKEGNMYRERRRCDWWIKTCPGAMWDCRGSVGEDEHKKNEAQGMNKSKR